jgi:hypothetical protein
MGIVSANLFGAQLLAGRGAELSALQFLERHYRVALYMMPKIISKVSVKASLSKKNSIMAITQYHSFWRLFN